MNDDVFEKIFRRLFLGNAFHLHIAEPVIGKGRQIFLNAVPAYVLVVLYVALKASIAKRNIGEVELSVLQNLPESHIDGLAAFPVYFQAAKPCVYLSEIINISRAAFRDGYRAYRLKRLDRLCGAFSVFPFGRGNANRPAPARF